MDKIRIKIPQHIRDICEKFSNDVIESNYDCYKNRGQDKLDQILYNLSNGKICQFAAWRWIKYNGFDIEQPDLTIYGKSKKSFDADLKLQNLNIHVKSCSDYIESRYGLSWSFQKQDSLINDTKNNDAILLTKLITNNKRMQDVVIQEVEICNFLYFSKIKKYLKSPIKQNFIGNKVVLYSKDIENIEEDLIKIIKNQSVKM